MPVVEGTAMLASIKTPNTTFTPEFQITLIVDDTIANDFASRGFRVHDPEAVSSPHLTLPPTT